MSKPRSWKLTLHIGRGDWPLSAYSELVDMWQAYVTECIAAAMLTRGCSVDDVWRATGLNRDIVSSLATRIKAVDIRSMEAIVGPSPSDILHELTQRHRVIKLGQSTSRRR